MQVSVFRAEQRQKRLPAKRLPGEDSSQKQQVFFRMLDLFAVESCKRAERLRRALVRAGEHRGDAQHVEHAAGRLRQHVAVESAKRCIIESVKRAGGAF